MPAFLRRVTDLRGGHPRANHALTLDVKVESRWYIPRLARSIRLRYDPCMTNSLARTIAASPYFAPAPNSITYAPFDADDSPSFATLADLESYAYDFDSDQTDNRPLRDRLIDALDADIADLLHNANHDALNLTDADAITDETIAELADILLARCAAI